MSWEVRMGCALQCAEWLDNVTHINLLFSDIAISYLTYLKAYYQLHVIGDNVTLLMGSAQSLCMSHYWWTHHCTSTVTEPRASVFKYSDEQSWWFTTVQSTDVALAHCFLRLSGFMANNINPVELQLRHKLWNHKGTSNLLEKKKWKKEKA